jgi:hypothetical protein
MESGCGYLQKPNGSMGGNGSIIKRKPEPSPTPTPSPTPSPTPTPQGPSIGGEIFAEYEIRGKVFPNETLRIVRIFDDPEGNRIQSYLWESSIDGEKWEEVKKGSDEANKYYLTQNIDLGKRFRAVVVYSNGRKVVTRKTNEVLIVENPKSKTNNTGKAVFQIIGIPSVGKTLKVDRVTRDPDGHLKPKVSAEEPVYTWQSSIDGTNWETIFANNSKIVVRNSEDGKYLRFIASYFDKKGFKETVYSNIVYVSPFGDVTSSLESQYEIRGIAEINQTLKVVRTIEDPYQIAVTSYNWQTLNEKNEWVVIKSSTESFYITKNTDASKKIRVEVTYTSTKGTKKKLTNIVTILDTVTPSPAPPPSPFPAPILPTVRLAEYQLRGIFSANQTLIVVRTVDDPDGNDIISYTWQSTFDGINWSNIKGGISNTYVTKNTDIGKKIRVIVSYTNSKRTSERITNEALISPTPITGPAPAPGPGPAPAPGPITGAPISTSESPFTQTPSVPTNTYDVVLQMSDIMVTNTGFNYNADDKIKIIPDNGAEVEPIYDVRGALMNVKVNKPGIGFTDFPKIFIESTQGVNAQMIPIFSIIRVGDLPEDQDIIPSGTPVVSVVDCVGRFR